MNSSRDQLRARYPVAATAWQAGLDKLKPSSAQLEHGLSLHDQLITLDTFGFMPSIWSDLSAARLNRMTEKGVCGNEWHFRSSVIRQTNASDDPAAAREFTDAIALSGLSGLVQSVAEGKTPDEDFRRMAGFQHLLRTLSTHIGQAATAQQVRDLASDARFACIWSCNGPPLPGHLRDPDEEFELIETWRHLGIRLMHLTYNRRNLVGDGCAEIANGGLSDLGRELVGRMNEAGIIVDVPHTGEQSCLDAAATSTKPIMASHTACKGLFEHIRTKSDRVLKAIADTDGLVGIIALPGFLGCSGDIHALLDHVTYAVKTIGVDHVSIGTDSAYQTPWPANVKAPAKTSFTSQWWGSWNQQRDYQKRTNEAIDGSLAWTNWPLFTVGLVQRGFSERDIEKLLGGNLLRVLEANEPQTIAGSAPRNATGVPASIQESLR